MDQPFLIDLKENTDERGVFFEKFNPEIEKKLNIIWVQENFSISKKNVLRGLHYQLNFPQAKLVHCINGQILDIVVDLRINSPWFGAHYKFLSMNNNMIFVPEGFAHGFLSLEENTIVEYKCSNIYKPNDSYTLLWNDKDLNIDWGIKNPILSEKDAKGLMFEHTPKYY